MDADRWERAKDLFARAIDLDPLRRSRLLAEACGEDVALRAEVESIIVAAEQAPAIFERPASALAADLLDDVPDESLEGRRIGRYRLIRRIAAGGMGTIYLADRADEQYEQQVAVKLIRRRILSAEVVDRFRRERQTLARLVHANIARLLDGGVTEDDVPYLVMEYVDGTPIDEYCDTHGLTTRQRLELFRDVCSAVQYAHQHLIVHRDLKPGNILVDTHGVPKLLDFGIAKTLNDLPSGASRSATLTTERRLTPAFASPEQIRAGLITTASDVYSLGVILYELLTGRSPYRAVSDVPYELERAICEVQPSKPSSVVRPPAEEDDREASSQDERMKTLHRRLAGDLDAIVLMALRKEPAERYASVERLSEDIRRHLEGLPVAARSGTAAYLTAKFLRRHRAGVAGAAVVLVSLLIGIIGAAWSARVALRERDAAREAGRRAAREAQSAQVEMRKSQRVTGFLQTLLASADPSHEGRNVTIVEVLDRASRNVSSEFARDREAASAVLSAIGQTYLGLGRYDDAEQNLRRALEIQRELHGEDHADVAGRLSDLGQALYAKGDFARAAELIKEAHAVHRRLYGDDNAAVARDLNDLGAVARAAGDLARAETLLREALDMRRRLFGDECLEVAESLNNLGGLLRAKGDSEAAVPLARDVLALRRRLLGEHHPAVAQSLDNLSVLLATTGDFESAEALCRESLVMYRELLGPDHPDVAVTLNNLARMLIARGDHLGALPYLGEAVNIRRRAFPDGHAKTALVENLLGRCLLKLDCLAEAEPLLLSSYPAIEAAAGPHHEHTKVALRALAELYDAMNNPSEAACYRERLGMEPQPTFGISP